MGGELISSLFHDFLDSYGIKHYLMKNTEVKAAIAERMISTLRNRIEIFTKHRKNKRFIDKIQLIVNNYNDSEHSGIQMKPRDVNINNQNEALLNLHRKRIHNRLSKLKVGDHVRLLKLKDKFSKGYKRSWTNEIFIIKKKLNTLPIQRYIIEDKNKQELIGSFYEQELIKIGKQNG